MFRRILLGLLFFGGCAAGGCDSTAAPADAGAVDAEAADGAVDPTLDTDGDGLTDEEERELRTNPDVADTDGDGFDDFEEVVTQGFDREANNYRFNPLIADFPTLEVELVSAPTFTLIYTEGTTSGQTLTTERSSSTSRARTRTQASSASQTVETTHSAEVSVSTMVGASGFLPEASVTATVTASTSRTEGRTSTVEFSDAQSVENAETLARAEALEQTSSITYEGGLIQVVATVSNPSQVAYVLNGLSLSAYVADPMNVFGVVPLASLQARSTSGSVFSPITLAPGEVSAPLVFEADLDVGTTKALLRDSSSLVLTPVIGGFEGPDGLNFELIETDINARTARVSIDYETGPRRPRASGGGASARTRRSPSSTGTSSTTTTPRSRARGSTTALTSSTWSTRATSCSTGSSSSRAGRRAPRSAAGSASRGRATGRASPTARSRATAPP